MSTLRDPMLGVLKLRERFGLKVFVETGCHTGEGLFAADFFGFAERWSCDLTKEWVDSASAADPGAKIKHADSVTFLREVLPSIQEPTLFWLDAHLPLLYNGYDDENTHWPLYEELRAIAECKPNFERDVILCDDIRCIVADDNPRYHKGEIPATLEDRRYRFGEYLALMPHESRCLFTTDTGVLLFTPWD